MHCATQENVRSRVEQAASITNERRKGGIFDIRTGRQSLATGIRHCVSLETVMLCDVKSYNEEFGLDTRLFTCQIYVV